MTNIFIYKNVKVPFYELPVFTDDPKDVYVKKVIRATYLQRQVMLDGFKNECELYYVGQYDDEKGVFNLLEEKEFLLDLAPFFKE